MKGGKQASACELHAAGVVALTKTQMAAALQISVRSLNGMMARGEIGFYRIGTRLVRFPVEEALQRMNETVLIASDEDEIPQQAHAKTPTTQREEREI